ncbi:MAG: CoA transferase [Chloroflexota bacterium]|nr:CoA transferase [Chloroflexota bacterium]
MPIKGPLTGIRLIDLSQGTGGGPYSTQLLGDLGVEVIKVEPPQGEISRDMSAGDSGGTDFVSLNRNKKSVVIDLNTNSGRQALHDLVRLSDVVVDNFDKGILEDLEIDYEKIRQLNPKIISASIVGYGSSGPHANDAVYDHMAQAISGMASICGEIDGKPIVQPTLIAEHTAGGDLAYGIIAALYERERTGVGRRLEVNLIHSCMGVMLMPLQFSLMVGMDPPPQGTRDPGTPILGFYRCKDGKYLAVGPSWPRIARVLDMEWMIDDPQWDNTAARAFLKPLMCDLLEREGFQKADAEDWLEILRAEDIPSSWLNTLDEVVKDPQVIHNKAVISMHHTKYGDVQGINCPISLVGTTEGEHSPPPILGENTEDILRDILCYSDDKLAELRKT